MHLGHVNQLRYLRGIELDIKGPTLEVGSKDYGNTQDFRGLIGGEYIGLDLEPGKNVDVVHNLEDGLGPFEKGQFGMIVCCSILEHVKNPWKVAQTLTDLLCEGGNIYISTPWIQRYHKYPDDYWRFTFPALKLLFPDLKLKGQHYSTFTDGEFMNLDEHPDCDNYLAVMYENRKYLPCLELHCIGTKPVKGETDGN